ncbi:hypothetical protein PENSPDRAFT_588216 [Peniophora sp. CONT]|nr:hypothetical protein PENSPDRAFT_588216 [Peniophora sp. CONT]
MASVGNPFSRTLRYMQWAAHEKPALFFAVAIASTAPVIMVVGNVLKSSGKYVAPEPVPRSYPLPQRQRKPVQGFEDE